MSASENPTGYRQYTYLLPAELEEIFTAELWELGVAGVEIRPAGDEIQVEAFFPAGSAGLVFELKTSPWHARGVRIVTDQQVENRDWLAEYRARARPFAVGRRWLLDPRDPQAGEALDTGGRELLRIPAMNAFGTGSHESTRLTLELLETLDLDGRQICGQQVLDVGCGSGILAFAALRLGARSVVAYDFDLPSVITARGNARLNALSPRWLASTAAALSPEARFDLLLVNVLPERIAADWPRLLGSLRPGGRLISSGNLASRREELLAVFAGYGLTPETERFAAEWVAWTLRRSPGTGS